MTHDEDGNEVDELTGYVHPNKPEDYTDPDTIDVYTVARNIENQARRAQNVWTDEKSWPNITVLAMVRELERLREVIRTKDAEIDDIHRQVGKKLMTGEWGMNHMRDLPTLSAMFTAD